MAFRSLSLLACVDAFAAGETATGATLAATAGAAFAALAADAGAPDPSAFPAASTLGGAFASGCLGPGLTAATVSVGGRLTGFGVLTVVFGAAGLAPTRFTMAFSVFFALRTGTATPPLRFRLATAALWDGFAATFFRGSVFPLAARFFVTADDDLPVARLRADLTDDFADLIPLDFAGFLVDFLRAAIRLSTHDRFLA